MGIKYSIVLFLNLMMSCAWPIDFWKNTNQQAFKFFQDKQYAKAQALFKDPLWKGIAAYRAKDYAHAAQYLSKLDTPDGFYNLGNAFAQMGQFNQAIQAYQKALILDAQHVDAAYNLQLLEQELQKEEEQKKKEEEQKKKETPQQNPMNSRQNNFQEWLSFINEDPAGLMKEKFRRDYQHVQEGVR